MDLAEAKAPRGNPWREVVGYTGGTRSGTGGTAMCVKMYEATWHHKPPRSGPKGPFIQNAGFPFILKVTERHSPAQCWEEEGGEGPRQRPP